MKTIQIILSLLCTCPILCSALDLSPISTDLTRKKADSLYKKAYRYTVLDDLSVRREWSDPEHTVTLDFEIAKDSLIMAEISYETPIERKEAAKHAEDLNGGNLDKWQRAKEEQTENVGLNNCYYVRTDKNQFYFMEVNEDKMATSLIYFSTTPKINRRELEEASTESFSAMGTSGTASAAASINEDEGLRLEHHLDQLAAQNKKTKPSSSSSSSRSTATTNRASTPTPRPNKTPAQSSQTSSTSTAKVATDGVSATTAAAQTAPTAVENSESSISTNHLLLIGGGVLALLILIVALKPKETVVRKVSTTKLPNRRLR